LKPVTRIGIDFTQGNIPLMLVKFVGPLLLANILNSLYNTVDMVIIGQYVGSTGTVAVSLGGKMLMFLTVIGTGLSSGGQILIAQQAGAKQNDQIKYSIGTLFSLLGIISLACSIICIVLSKQIIGWLNTPPEAVDAALAYLRITSIGLPLIFGYTAVSSVLRGMGDSKNPLLFIGIAATLNLILDIVFIVNFHLGAAGTALATVIGQGVSLVISVILLYKRRGDLGFDFKLKSFAIDKEKCRIILRIGLPMAAQSGMIQVTQLFIMSYVNMFGLVQAAAYGIGDKIIHLLNVVQQSMMQGGGAMAGQNIGAGKQERVRKLVWTVLAVNISVTAVVSFFMLLFPGAVFSLFTKDPQVLAYSFSFMLITIACLFLSSIMGAFSGVTTGTGNSQLSFLAGFLDGVIFRIAFSFLFGFTLHMEVTGFFLGNTLARLGPIVVHCPYYFSGAWKRRKRLVDENIPLEEPLEAAE
jgi:putative MATE family efflux protein